MVNGNIEEGNRFFVETTFVLFFLSLDLGQNLFSAAFDTAFLAFTVCAVAVLPYFLPSAATISLTNWLTGRTAIIFLGTLLGVVFSQVIGIVLPEAFRFLPLMFATVAAVAACYSMFMNFYRFDYAD